MKLKNEISKLMKNLEDNNKLKEIDINKIVEKDKNINNLKEKISKLD